MKNSLARKAKGGYTMRHFYFRLILGSIWVLAGVFSVIVGNLTWGILYLVLAVIFLGSAYSMWKKGKGGQ